MTTKIKSGVIGDNVVGITQLNVSDGTNGQVLTTDGSGTLSFSTISGYTDSDVETYLNTSEIYTDPTNNRLSIGTSSPSAGLLTLSGVDGGSTAGIYFNNTTASTGKSYRLNSGNTGEFMLYDITSSAYRIFVDTSGNVGIGEVSPDAKLDIRSSGTSTYPLLIKSSDDQQLFRFREESDSRGTFYINDDSGDTKVTLASSGSSSFMGGSVGIGITSPSGEFHVDSGLAPCDIHFTTGSTGGTGYDVNLNMTGGANNSEMNLNMGIAGDADREQIKTYQSTMTFTTANTARMRITSSGEVNIDNTFTGAKLNIKATGSDTSNWCQRYYTTGTASELYVVDFIDYQGQRVGYITNNPVGNSTAYVTLSDYRLKENVDYTWDATTRLKQLRPARFNWIRDESNTLVDGFLAHEVEDIVPEAITGDKDATETKTNAVLNSYGNYIADNITEEEWLAGKEDGTYDADTTWTASHTQNLYQGIDQAKLVPLLVKTIQELEARITTLENA